MTRKKIVSLMLLENVDNLGIVGDVIEVKPGYARNYLLPMGLATAPTEAARAAVEERRAEVERQLRELREQREKLIAALEAHEVTLQRAANEAGVLFGSVTQADIADALREEGFAINERDVRIGDPIKRLDSYMIPIKVDDDLETEIKLWVVSDKPAEELLEDEDGSSGEAGDGEPTEEVIEEAPAEASVDAE